jgi:hypothetical protein
MKYALYVAAALLTFAAGVSLFVLYEAVPDTRLAFHPGSSEDLAAVVLAFMGGLACEVLAAAGWRGARRDLVYSGLLFFLGSLLLAFSMWTLTTMFAFESRGLVF